MACYDKPIHFWYRKNINFDWLYKSSLFDFIIKENKKKAADLKLVAQVAQMNSALDLLKKISEVSPQKEQVKIDLVTFKVKDDQVQMIGYANSPKEVTLLTKNLQALAIGSITEQPAQLAAVANRVAFNISFKTDRGLIKWANSTTSKINLNRSTNR